LISVDAMDEIRKRKSPSTGTFPIFEIFYPIFCY
jgi:hypothetical protein